MRIQEKLSRKFYLKKDKVTRFYNNYHSFLSVFMTTKLVVAGNSIMKIPNQKVAVLVLSFHQPD